ncbi:hypothetical protein CJU90_3911 [Yarrowia sp. C11]|nr:hypothetical protein CKK34_5523 [Yarrowia sp. E02]KAG5367610.1 hypothetical protein CJU90_3911 [Yarrowia sp. C11]
MYEYYAVAKGLVPGIYTSNQVAVNQVLYYSANCMKGFKHLADAQKFMMASGSIQSSGSMALMTTMAPAIALGIAYLAYTLYADPEMRANLLQLYESLPELALGVFEKAVEMYHKMEQGFVPEQLEKLGLNFKVQ